MEGDLTGLQVVEKITAANKDFKDDVVLKAKTEVEKVSKEMEDFKLKVEEKNKEIVEMGGTIKDLQENVKEMKSIQGRQGYKNTIDAKAGLLMTITDAVNKNMDRFLKMDGSENSFGESIQMTHKVSTITSASLATQPYANFLPWQPGMEPIGQTRVRQFVNTVQSDVDTVYFPRANTPPGGGSFSQQLTENTLKAQVDRGWTMQTVTLYPTAGWAAVSRQSLRNIIFMQTWLPTSLLEQLLDTEDLIFANALVAAATGSSTTTGITVANERLIFMIKNLMIAKYRPTAICLDPAIWAGILVTKPSNYSLPNVVTASPDGSVRILGIPVYPVNWLTGGRFLMGDFTKASIVESEGLTLRQSENGTSQDFMKNVVTFLMERTENIAIFRPDAFITGILTLP